MDSVFKSVFIKRDVVLKSVCARVSNLIAIDHCPNEPMTRKFSIPKDEIAGFCRRHHISRLSLFGSVLTGDFRPDSDVDVLVEFQPGYTPGLAFFEMEEELSGILGRKVDLNTPGFLSHYFRDRVLAEAEVQYAAL